MHQKTAANCRKREIRGILGIAAAVCVMFGAPFVGCNVLAETLAETGILAPIPKSEDPTVAAVRDAMLTDNFDSARVAIKILSQKSPRSGQAEYWAGLLCLRTGQSEDAVRYLRASQKLADNAYTDEALALAYYSVKQFKLFVASMSRASQSIPDNFAPYYYLGRYYVSVEVADFQQAETLLTKAVKYDQQNARSIYYLGLCKESRGDLERAEFDYKQVLSLPTPNPHYLAMAELGVARVAMSTNRNAEALTYAQKAEAALPQEAEVHTILAKLYTTAGDLQAAVQEWKATESLDPTNTGALYNLYRLYLKAGNDSLAKEAFDQYKAMSKLYGTS